MTCLRTDLHWRDALYNAVTQVPGGLRAAAAFLTERRGRSITGESLRKKLRGLEGESISVEMAEMLTEWMEEHVAGQALAKAWIQSLGSQFGLAMDFVPVGDGGLGDEVAAIQTKLLHICRHAGSLSGLGLEAIADGDVSRSEADALVREARAARTMLHRLERSVLRAHRKSRGRA
ncbi:hypothetical protein [Pseudoxanthomonas winnipegensis]|uniref:Uncharacterized protein n=1 Tax=Pseudoxanthomonas winnipegensis TaxID=2480810 RepID=A0A4Q8M7H3_9GAMM|nr:hypothetical protein [Pseudoxanthomonas winnipegensis]TAA45664.1 hypothetical protein EA655_05625 [Pseudoxanthomonas winnipegensis]